MHSAAKSTVGITILLIFVCQPALADLSLEVGPGREKGSLVMITLSNRASDMDERLSANVHYGIIERDGEQFQLGGVDLVIGQSFLLPYILIYLGVTHFDRLTTRLGTNVEAHVALEIGFHGDTWGTFLKIHHWSNGSGGVTGARGPNTGEEFSTVGILARW